MELRWPCLKKGLDLFLLQQVQELGRAKNMLRFSFNTWIVIPETEGRRYQSWWGKPHRIQRSTLLCTSWESDLSAEVCRGQTKSSLQQTQILLRNPSCILKHSIKFEILLPQKKKIVCFVACFPQEEPNTCHWKARDQSECNLVLTWADTVKDKQGGDLQGNPLSHPRRDYNWTANIPFQKTCLRLFKLYNVKCDTTGTSRPSLWRGFVLFIDSSTAAHSRQGEATNAGCVSQHRKLSVWVYLRSCRCT